MTNNSKHSIRRWAWRLVMTAIAIVIVGSIVMAWMPKPVVVDIATVKQAPMTVTVEETGTTRVKDRYVISAPLAGNLARPDQSPGDGIVAGSVVARLTPLPAPLLGPQSRAQARARLAAAEAGYKQAQAGKARGDAAVEFAAAELKRIEPLAKAGNIPSQRADRAKLELRTQQQDLASSSFGVRVARHEVEVARAALGQLGKTRGKSAPPMSHMSLKSPVDGVVLAILHEHEGVVQAGTPLVEIADPNRLEIVVDVLTTDAVQVKPGAKATIVRWGKDIALDAHVRRVEPKAFTRISSLGVEEQRANVVLDLDSPREAWAALGDGFRVEASIVVWELPDTIIIPASAAFKHDGKWAVFVSRDGVAHLRNIELGKRNGFDAQVLNGLKTGDKVVLHPGEGVADGTSIQAR